MTFCVRIAPYFRTTVRAATRWVALIFASLGIVAAAFSLAEAGQARQIASSAPPSETSREGIVAIDSRLDGDEKSVRLGFMVSGPVEAHAFVMANPNRVIVDLPEINFQFGHEAGRKGTGLVRSFRFGLFAPGRSRIVMDLTAPALVKQIAVTPAAEKGLHNVTLELQRTDRETFQRTAALHRASEPVAAPVATGALPKSLDQKGSEARNAAKPLIVIDPGHGGIDPGARARNGLNEKDIVFAFACKLRDMLTETGRYRVVMTRDTDVFVALRDRVRMARDLSADLFISVHADTLSVAAGVRGATIYTGSERATDAAAARLAEKENQADSIAGLDTKDDREDVVSGILNELTVRETRAFSHNFAKAFVKNAGSAINMNKNPHRSAGFRVLTAPDVPSVLVELGYLSSDKDIELLTSDTWRAGATASIVNSVNTFFAHRLAKTDSAN